jgi:GTP-binding protein EngB required for normal cell division
MFSKLFNKNISLIFYSNYTISEEVVKEIERQLEINQKSKFEDNFYSKITYDSYFIQNMYFLLNKYSNEEKKLKDFMKIIELNQTIIEFRTLLIFIDEDNLIDSLMKVINKYYKNQIFIVIFTNKDLNNLRLDITEKINKLTETKRSYFDMNNIFIYKNENNGHKKILMTILKIFAYFNQLGDWFFMNLFENGLSIDGLDEEVKHLFYTHYFNILLCGRTGTGKSTFINKIMGEKKSFTLKTKSAGTERNNYYIHKDYPIKIIDVCGFAEGSEGKETSERLNLIYNKNSNNIIIDESMNDIFNFYEDKRNNIHLLLYFNVYNDKYDVLPGELPVVYDAKDKNIPFIFIINKCKDEIFNDEDEKKDLLDEIIEVRKNTDFENNKTFFINCINGNGFKELLTGIFEHYQNSLISKENLEKINENTMNKEVFKNYLKIHFF